MSDEPPAIAGLIYSRPLGAGGYSDVYLYEQAVPRRNVAVKVLRNVGLTDTVRQQFTAEANAMAELADHPNIVPVFAADVSADGRPYLVMMYYPRPNLGVRAANERFAVSDVLRIGIQIASAVETAHRAGIVHRDIKPANILTSQYGAPGLTDFGIAGQVTAVEDDDDTGVSVPWSPPEVLYATAPASVRSDVYSLAATLWHVLVGRSPFEIAGGDNSPFALMRRVRDSAAPSTGRADVPTSLDRLLQQAMSKNPIARPASALEFARALQAVEQEQRLARTDIVVLTEEVQPTPRSVVREQTDPTNTDATRMRAPMRVEAQPVSPPTAGPPAWPAFVEPSAAAAALVEAPASPTVSRPSNVGGSHRQRVLPDQPVNPTVRRAAPIAPDARVEPGDEAPPGRRGLRLPIVIGIGVVVVVAAVVLGLVLTSGHGKRPTAGPTLTQSSGVPDDIGPPGPVTVVGTRVDAATVRFTWTYGNAAPGSDSFRWQTSDAVKSGTVKTPTLDLPDPAGTSICVQVKVVRADGSDAALEWSTVGCTT